MENRALEPALDRLFQSLEGDEQSRSVGGYTALITHRLTFVNGIRDTIVDAAPD
ncbi:MAG TPA: hypothetical protein VEZ90_17900 [Blastocatellia bacterium]|nr:hypothetical protein [Blastocatellia bacterium]